LEDVCAEATAKAWSALGDFREDTLQAFCAWLKTIAWRTIANCLRTLRRRKKNFPPTPLAEGSKDGFHPPALDTSLPTRAANEELQRLLERALNQLSPDERRLIELWSDSRTHAEIAEEIGCTPKTAGRRCQRALDKLDTLMREAYEPRIGS
jgi:RNA polymerase sigma factor (sigma-70 family)